MQSWRGVPPQAHPTSFPGRPKAFPQGFPLPHPSHLLTSLRMAERRPLSHPRVAWEEVGAPQESRSPPEPCEVCVVQPVQAGEWGAPASHPPALRPPGRLLLGSGHGNEGQSSFLCPLLPAAPLYSPPCPPLLLDASWLAVYEAEQETVDFIQAFFKSSEKVTVAISIAAVPVSPDGTHWLCCLLLGALLAGQSCSPAWLCTPSTLVPLAMSRPLTLPLCLSVPWLPGRDREDAVPRVHLHPLQSCQAQGLVAGPGCLLPQI